MKISIAHATRRPALALEIRKLWLSAAKHPDKIEWIFAIDSDDASSLSLLTHERHVVCEPGGGSTFAYNAAAKETIGEIIIAVADDTHPFPYWDTAITGRLVADRPQVLLTGDGYRLDRLATLPIITRAWYQRYGFLFPPQFKTMGPDLWLTERASRDSCLVYAEDLVFEHRHAFYKKAEMDEVYRRQNDPTLFAHANAVIKELLEPLPISLCLMVGNEAEIIERLLNSAADAFDQLCLVRAIGNQLPDQTIARAEAWCQAKSKKFRFAEYENKIDFPHVDDFSAALNLAFSLATSYWCLRLDADDLIDELNCRRVRETASNTRFECFRFPYLLENGGMIYRERLIKRGRGLWQDAIHETCKINGATCIVPQVEIKHAPVSGHEATSVARNLALLQIASPVHPRARFYLHEEFLRAGRRKEAEATGLALAEELNGNMPAEHYEVLLNLAELQPEKTEHWCFEALRLDPGRREALSQLIQFALDCGDVPRAAHLFRWMDTIPEPNPKPWTHRPIWYPVRPSTPNSQPSTLNNGWARNWLKIKILRAAGQTAAAAAAHAEYIADPNYAAALTSMPN